MKKIITVILSMTALTLLLASVTITAKRYATVSEVYLRYKDRADLQVSFVKDCRIDDSTTVDVTTLTARDSASWEKLLREMNTPSALIDINNKSLQKGHNSTTTYLSKKNHPDERTEIDIDGGKNDLVVFSYRERIIYIFDITSQNQSDIIQKNKRKEILHKKDNHTMKM